MDCALCAGRGSRRLGCRMPVLLLAAHTAAVHLRMWPACRWPAVRQPPGRFLLALPLRGLCARRLSSACCWWPACARALAILSGCSLLAPCRRRPRGHRIVLPATGRPAGAVPAGSGAGGGRPRCGGPHPGALRVRAGLPAAAAQVRLCLCHVCVITEAMQRLSSAGSLRLPSGRRPPCCLRLAAGGVAAAAALCTRRQRAPRARDASLARCAVPSSSSAACAARSLHVHGPAPLRSCGVVRWLAEHLQSAAMVVYEQARMSGLEPL